VEHNVCAFVFYFVGDLDAKATTTTTTTTMPRSPPSNRKSPPESASDFAVGTRRKGLDGSMWEIVVVRPRDSKKSPYRKWQRVAAAKPAAKPKKPAVVASKKKKFENLWYTLAIDSGMLAMGDPSAHFDKSKRVRDDLGMVPVDDILDHSAGFSQGDGIVLFGHRQRNLAQAMLVDVPDGGGIPVEVLRDPSTGQVKQLILHLEDD
jgi:hypothetical protein